jgi:cytochrome P450
MIRHWFSDVHAFRRDPLSLILARGTATKDAVVRLALGPSPVLLVRDASLVKPLMKLSEAMLDKGRLVRKLRSVLGLSSLTLSGEAHRARRAVLHERLSRGVAETYAGEMLATIRATCVQLSREKSFRADLVGGSLALKLVCVALFGHRVLSAGDELAVMQAVNALEADLQNEMFRFLPRTPWRKRRDLKIRRNALATMEMILNKVRERAANSSVLTALRDLGLSETELRDEIITMLIAGYHTTGAAIAWLCHYMASEPAAVESICREYKTLADESGEIAPGKLPGAQASLTFVKEVLRLYPSAWWTTREVRTDCEVQGIRLRRGTTLIVSPWLYHRDAANFDQPDRFSLERSYGSAAYLPFGAGPRACVGMGVALLELQLVVLEFAASLSFRNPISSDGLQPSAAITLLAPPIEIDVALRDSHRFAFQEAA